MLQRTDEQWLVLFLNETLAFSVVSKDVANTFRFDSRVYESRSGDFLPGFFDRLVDERGELVGVRFTPVSNEASELVNQLRSKRYASVADSFADVWLAEAPVESVRCLHDQAFGGQVFRANTGAFALTLDVNFLFEREADWQRLNEANAEWIAPERVSAINAASQ